MNPIRMIAIFKAMYKHDSGNFLTAVSDDLKVCRPSLAEQKRRI